MKAIFLILLVFCIADVIEAQQKSLDYFVQQAISNSPLLNDYRNQVQIHQVDSLRIRAAYKPQVNGTGTGLYAPIIGGYGYDGAITNGGQLTAVVGVNQALISKKYLG